ncbi:hypothetical protein [Kribbella sp. NPDC006257]|uniref:hypothetical protein n=1 Tax=Kribbella sp. NPDC006257 TaxID=3156738 RepID=UPI00339F9137
MRTDDALLMPVGHDLGVLFPEPGSDRHRQQVRLGAEVIELEDRDYAVWLLAHGTGGDNRPRLGSLAATAHELGLDGIELTVKRFLNDGLLVAVEPGEAQAVEFAERHQLVPLMLGLGGTPESPGMQRIGLLGQPVVEVSNALYDVWAWTRLAPELWTGCQDAATVAQHVGVTNPEEIDPHQVLAGVLQNVHALLCVRAAYFDRRVR